MPAESEILDVGVGENVTRELELVAHADVDWATLSLFTSCDCLSAEYVGAPEPRRARVRMTVNGIEPEDVTGGVVGVQDDADGKKTLAEHLTHVAIRRVPFVAPRVVDVAPAAQPQFDLVVGQAFALDAELPASILVDLSIDAIDGSRIELLDMADEKLMWPVGNPKSWVLQTRLTFAVVAKDLAPPFTTSIPVEWGEPPVKRAIEVRWPGRK